ncbi:5-formyltetrahydrofolate cyclo-ligase [Thalassotalea sp. PS06]|uniref:5-formyltetrahydrofolate cyclo-ligase n=1 Tax=Thalassotalea sp. PS06 TaxID=2594005 RepID=UPI00116525E1|nr:5-formyltetrahydrofolate cyclo-ligase [Thalassotalea sp. PS06]QDP00438.1 5-formyltetrahydrofolate cyclo-ligase [Thalassotalea sp. PS06]
MKEFDYFSLRNELKQKRKALSLTEQSLAAEQLSLSLQSYCRTKNITRVAGYIAANGEIDLAPFFTWCDESHIQVCVPVLHPFSKGHLLFLQYDKNTPMITNRYQLKEPQLDVGKVIPTQQIDLLVTPLVGFDINGNRLGMGGGYYDRTLASNPALQDKAIGVAHKCQQVESLKPQPWDIPLKKIIAV